MRRQFVGNGRRSTRAELRRKSAIIAGYVQATITPDHTALIAYELASRFWRRGIGSTAVKAMMSELTAAYGVGTFVAQLKERNHRSFALLSSMGFERVGHSSDEIVVRKSVAAYDMS